MNKKRLFATLLLSFLATLYYVQAHNNPLIINFSRNEYHADSKNWSISQDERGFVYFGNAIGLLEFDGIDWRLNSLPNSSIIRSVYAHSHNKIYTGGYEEFGYWDRDLSGQLKYTSLSSDIDKNIFYNDDFWRIVESENKVYFQSFNSIYVYDQKNVRQIKHTKGFLFLEKVRDEMLVQEMQGMLYKLKDEKLEAIEGSEIFKDTDVRVILPYMNDKYLIGTTTKGIYIYDGQHFKEWNSALSKELIKNDLNCGIYSAFGTYFLGTILNGIYEIDMEGNIINHIFSDNTLQNNTVLSLSQDNFGNIWAGLDRGISCAKYWSNLSSYTDIQGNVGAVYDAIFWNNKLFLGTNQGLFYINKEDLNRFDALKTMKLVNGTQGQVWSLYIHKNRLLCCHNRGLKEIYPNLTEAFVYDLKTGVYNITEANMNGKNVLLLATYSSFRIIIDEVLHDPLPLREPIMNIETDHLGNIWLEHANKGCYRSKLNENLKSVKLTYYGGDSNDGLPYKLKLFKVGGRILFVGNDKFYTYNDINDVIEENNKLNACFAHIKGIKQIIPIKNNLFWALTSTSVYKFQYDGYDANIIEDFNIGVNRRSLVNGYENVSVLNESTSLICLENGFLLYNEQTDTQKQTASFSPQLYIEAVSAYKQDGTPMYVDTKEEFEIPFIYNSLTFSFSAQNVFVNNLRFQYMLQGVDKDWSEAKKINKVSYARLSAGKYKFMLRYIDNMGKASEPVVYEFEVLPAWYFSPLAYVAYMLIFVITALITWKLILRRYRNIHLLKIRMRETKRLQHTNELLQNKVEEKNAELLSQTSFIIQRNELILKIKNEVEHFNEKNNNKAFAPLFHKINSLLNKNMDAEEDWKMFLIKFEEKHTGFFQRLKNLYPQLTPSDLRLCACLRLNMDSKDIAALMDISIRGIENSRYRIRKKLNISQNQNLTDFLMSI